MHPGTYFFVAGGEAANAVATGSLFNVSRDVTNRTLVSAPTAINIGTACTGAAIMRSGDVAVTLAGGAFTLSHPPRSLTHNDRPYRTVHAEVTLQAAPTSRCLIRLCRHFPPLHLHPRRPRCPGPPCRPSQHRLCQRRRHRLSLKSVRRLLRPSAPYAWAGRGGYQRTCAWFFR